MSLPRPKRPFAGASVDPSQRQITNFFRTTSADALPPSSLSTSTPSSSLPASIQSNLLSVGMRVRKSVPEGYKTGTPYSTFSLWSDSTTSSAIQAPITSVSPTAAPAVVSSRRELLPFCGLHRVGGLAPQPAEEVWFCESVFDDPPVPSLTSSQDSESSASTVLSTASGAPNRKRVFPEDERPERPVAWRDIPLLDGEVSPRTVMPQENGSNSPRVRVLAVPKRPSGQVGRKRSGLFMGQENVEMVVDERSGNDFEDADFLEFQGWVEGRDFEMGDV